MPESHDATLLEIHLKEYEALKDEQLKRIDARDKMIYTTLAAAAATVGAALAKPEAFAALLALPFVCGLTGWVYLVNDDKVSAIGRYIRRRLDRRVARAAGATGRLFHWEVAHRSDANRMNRKRVQLAVDLATFVGGPAVGLAIYWRAVSVTAAGVAATLAGVATLLVLAHQICHYADLRGSARVGAGTTKRAKRAA